MKFGTHLVIVPLYVLTVFYYNSLKNKFTSLLHKNLVYTSQETYYVSATNVTQSMLLMETNAVYNENHMKHVNTRIFCK
jgi:hypothetical protein